MAEERFLLVRLGSLGDIVFALPAASALRESFPHARIDWVVERKWGALLEKNPALDNLILLDRGWLGTLACVRQLRAVRYTCAIDFQGLYKSAALAVFAGIPRRVGFERSLAREGGATILYTDRANRPGLAGEHMVDQNLALVERAGARRTAYRFPLHIPPTAEAQIEHELAARGLRDFFVLSPGGGWRSKCWPPERFGQLHRELVRRYGWRGVVSFGPDERALAEGVRSAAGEPEPVVWPLDLVQLMALLRRAKVFVGGDTGPLHLAVALGTPVVGLYGPTEPKRNGPFCPQDVVVRNARSDETSYKRRRGYSASMLSITVEQVLAGVARRLGMD